MIITVGLEHTTAWDMAVALAQTIDDTSLELSPWPPESALITGIKALSLPVGNALYIRRRYHPKPAHDNTESWRVNWGVWDRHEHKWILDPSRDHSHDSALLWRDKAFTPQGSFTYVDVV